MPVVSRSMRLTDRGIYWVLAAALAAAGLIPEFRSLGNLANVAIIPARHANPVALVRSKNVLITKAAVAKLEEMLK